MARYKKGAKARDADIFNDIGSIPLFAINRNLIKATAISDKKLNAQYTKLRDISQKRLKRMAKKGEAKETFSQHVEGFPKLKSLKSRAEVVNALIDVTRFVTAERGSISGIRTVNKKIIKTLNKKGINIEKKELEDFGNYMSKMKKVFGIESGSLGSDLIAEMWDSLKKKGRVTQRDFDARMKAISDEVRKEEGTIIKPNKRGTYYSSAFFKSNKRKKK